jgi:hypothetical protein
MTPITSLLLVFQCPVFKQTAVAGTHSSYRENPRPAAPAMQRLAIPEQFHPADQQFAQEQFGRRMLFR